MGAHAEEFARQLYGCGSACTPPQIQEAKSRLIVEASARVDAVMAERVDGTDGAAEAFINTHPATFTWGEGFTATRDQYNQFKYFADVLAADRNAFTDLAVALGDAGWTKQDFQNAYYDQLLAVASAQRGSDGVAMLETFSGDVGMALGVVRKLVQGDTKGASTDVILAAMPWGIAKVVGPMLRPVAQAAEGTIWVNGKVVSDVWANAKGELTWLNPLTGVKEVVSDSAKVHVDHILPQDAIKKIEDFDLLPKDVQKQLLNDPENLQPMIASANCSKGCNVEGIGTGWVTWNGQPVSAAYKQYLTESQQAFRAKVEKAIDAFRASEGR